MCPNLPYIARIEQARRDEAERAAVQWRSSRLFAPHQPQPQWVFELGKRVRWLVQRRGQPIERTSALGYAPR